MKTSVISLFVLLLLTGCGVGYESTPYGNTSYIYGEHGWLIEEEDRSYTYEQQASQTLYFETPYLSRGCRVYIDIYQDYNYAYVDADTSGMHLYDQWFVGDDEAHYVYEVHNSGYQYLWIEDLHPSTIVHINYGC